MFEPTIYVASDGEGWIIKKEIVQHLSQNNKQFSIKDIGPQHEEPVDFPILALMVSDLVKESPGNHLSLIHISEPTRPY